MIAMTRVFKAHKVKPAPGTALGIAPGASRAAERATPASPTARAKPLQPAVGRPKEIGGPAGPEPTRYGDWERNGICYDF